MTTSPESKSRKTRKKPVTWFNPPYSMNIATNVGKEFLMLIDEHFPPGHPLHSVINRSTVKVSYRCLPNMGASISRHNSKILKANKGDGLLLFYSLYHDYNFCEQKMTLIGR